jgi:hypothetical protein
VRAKLEVVLAPFTIPNYVRRDKKSCAPGDDTDPVFPLTDVDADTLSAMCDQFREKVFNHAGKKDPRL